MRLSKLVLAASAVAALVVLSSGDAQAQRPGGIGFGGFQSDPISLLRSQGVRQELELEADQVKQVEAVRREMDAEVEKSRREIAAKYTEKVEKLLQPAQVERLRQISLQMRGNAALTDTDVAKKLGLSEAQQKEIADKRAEGAKKVEALRAENDGRFNRESFEKMREIQQETDQAVLNVLSDSQKKEYETLKGKEFDRTRLFGGQRKKQPNA
jgi:hypothetical protein